MDLQEIWDARNLNMPGTIEDFLSFLEVTEEELSAYTHANWNDIPGLRHKGIRSVGGHVVPIVGTATYSVQLRKDWEELRKGEKFSANADNQFMALLHATLNLYEHNEWRLRDLPIEHWYKDGDPRKEAPSV